MATGERTVPFFWIGYFRLRLRVFILPPALAAVKPAPQGLAGAPTALSASPKCYNGLYTLKKVCNLTAITSLQDLPSVSKRLASLEKPCPTDNSFLKIPSMGRHLVLRNLPQKFYIYFTISLLGFIDKISILCSQLCTIKLHSFSSFPDWILSSRDFCVEEKFSVGTKNYPDKIAEFSRYVEVLFGQKHFHQQLEK